MAKVMPVALVQLIVRSHVPLGEDEEAFQSIKQKVEEKQQLSKREEDILERLAGKAKKWEDDVKRSAETEPENTLGG